MRKKSLIVGLVLSVGVASGAANLRSHVVKTADTPASIWVAASNPKVWRGAGVD